MRKELVSRSKMLCQMVMEREREEKGAPREWYKIPDASDSRALGFPEQERHILSMGEVNRVASDLDGTRIYAHISDLITKIR